MGLCSGLIFMDSLYTLVFATSKRFSYPSWRCQYPLFRTIRKERVVFVDTIHPGMTLLLFAIAVSAQGGSGTRRVRVWLIPRG